MESVKRTSMHSAQDANDDGGSSDYEKRNGSGSDAIEEKDIAMHAREEEHLAASGPDMDPTKPGRRSQSRRSQDGRSLKTIRSHHSRAGGDGYTCLDPEANAGGASRAKPGGAVTEQPYLVTWDGDADPENPRSMSKLRRWAIVLICSASSLCVYVVNFRRVRRSHAGKGGGGGVGHQKTDHVI